MKPWHDYITLFSSFCLSVHTGKRKWTWNDAMPFSMRNSVLSWLSKVSLLHSRLSPRFPPLNGIFRIESYVEHIHPKWNTLSEALSEKYILYVLYVHTHRKRFYRRKRREGWSLLACNDKRLKDTLTRVFCLLHPFSLASSFSNWNCDCDNVPSSVYFPCQRVKTRDSSLMMMWERELWERMENVENMCAVVGEKHSLPIFNPSNI